LIELGLTGDGTHVIQFFRDPNDPALADLPFAQTYHEWLTEQGLDPSNSVYAQGYRWGWYFTAALQDASTYHGGLNRANLMLAARAIDTINPLVVPGLTTRTWGDLDAYLFQGGQMYRYTVEDPQELGTYVPVGDVINQEGMN